MQGNHDLKGDSVCMHRYISPSSPNDLEKEAAARYCRLLIDMSFTHSSYSTVTRYSTLF